MVFADVPEKESTTDPVYLSLENTVKHLGLVHNKFQVTDLINNKVVKNAIK